MNVKQLKDKINEVTTTVNNKYNEYLDQSKTYTSESGKVRANLSGVASGGEVGVGAGMSFTLN